MEQSVFQEFIFWQKKYFNAIMEQMFDLSMSNPFFFSLVCILLAFSLEAFLPRQLNYDLVKRKGFKLDLFYFFFYDFLIAFLGIFAVTHLLSIYYYSFFENLGYGKTELQIMNIKECNPIIQVLVLFVISDFMEWLAHLAMHRFDFLWAFHKVHHANEEIGVASSRRFHIFEYFILKPAVFIPLSFLGFGATDYAFYSGFVFAFLAFFTHANAKIPLGPLNYIINSPNTHIWHHAKNIPGKYGVNFASALNIWDVIFGFYYLPKENEKPELGIDDIKEVPMNFFGQLAYPFVYLFSRKNKSNEFAAATASTPNIPSIKKVSQKVKSKKKPKNKK